MSNDQRETKQKRGSHDIGGRSILARMKTWRPKHPCRDDTGGCSILVFKKPEGWNRQSWEPKGWNRQSWSPKAGIDMNAVLCLECVVVRMAERSQCSNKQ